MSTNNQNSNGSDKIDFHPDNAIGPMEEPRKQLVGNESSVFGFKIQGQVSSKTEPTYRIRICVKCNKSFLNDQDLHAHSCNRNTTCTNSIKLLFMNRDTNKRNEVPNKLLTVPGKILLGQINTIKLKCVTPQTSTQRQGTLIIGNGKNIINTKQGNINTNIITTTTPVLSGKNISTTKQENSHSNINKLANGFIIPKDDVTNNSLRNINLNIGNITTDILTPENNDTDTKPKNIDLDINNITTGDLKPGNIVPSLKRVNNCTSDDLESNDPIVDPDVFLNPTRLTLDTVTKINKTTSQISRFEYNNNFIEDTSILMNIEDKNPIEVADELINPHNIDDSFILSPISQHDIDTTKENSDMLLNKPKIIEHEILSDVLQSVSADMDRLIGPRDIENNNSESLPTTKANESNVTDEDCIDNVKQVSKVDIKHIVNIKNHIKELETITKEENATLISHIEELKEVALLQDNMNSSIYLEDGVRIEDLDIIKDTEDNMEVIDPNVVLENVGEEIKDITEKNVSETVIIEDSMDVIDLDDTNNSVCSVYTDCDLENVDPEAILENDDFDPKALESCMDVLDPDAVITDRIDLVDSDTSSDDDLLVVESKPLEKTNSKIVNDTKVLNVEYSKIEKERNNDMAVDNSEVVVGCDVEKQSKCNIVGFTNIKIECFTKDSDGNMQAVDSETILGKGAQIEILNSFTEEVNLIESTPAIKKANKKDSGKNICHDVVSKKKTKRRGRKRTKHMYENELNTKNPNELQITHRITRSQTRKRKSKTSMFDLNVYSYGM